MTQAEFPIWNMFRRLEEEELWCAVPADAAVPRFLFSGEWAFGGQHPELRLLPGFKHASARHGVSINGFYLFQTAGVAS